MTAPNPLASLREKVKMAEARARALEKVLRDLLTASDAWTRTESDTDARRCTKAYVRARRVLGAIQ